MAVKIDIDLHIRGDNPEEEIKAIEEIQRLCEKNSLKCTTKNVPLEYTKENILILAQKIAAGMCRDFLEAQVTEDLYASMRQDEDFFYQAADRIAELEKY